MCWSLDCKQLLTVISCQDYATSTYLVGESLPHQHA